MKKSETTSAVMAAIVKAQGAMQGAKKGSANPFFNSKYADLGAVMEATKDALHENGLAIVQFPVAAEGKCGVETVLVHESGEWISSECLLACAKQDPQAYGSAITYARRYGWQAVCGIPSEDDDANHATHGSAKPKQQQPQQQPTNPHDEFKTRATTIVAKHHEALEKQPELKKWVDACAADGFWRDIYENLVKQFGA